MDNRAGRMRNHFESLSGGNEYNLHTAQSNQFILPAVVKDLQDTVHCSYMFIHVLWKMLF